jgi:hypothetical protein
LLWTSRSLRTLSKELANKGHEVSHTVVGELLQQAGYSLQANRKTREGNQHMDRDAQFQYINARAASFLKDGQPVVSVDTKKKELVGNFKNAGREWRPQDSPEDVNVHDFIDPKLKRAVPYGVYDIRNNTGWVSVGTDHDTAAFAVIRRWWRTMGKKRYANPKGLMVTADGGGSNLSDQCAKGNPQRTGSSQASALISTMTLGGKTRRSPAARLFFEPGQALKVETPAPLADDLARCVEPCGDRVIGHSLARQQHDLGSNDIAVTRRVAARAHQQFRPFRFAQFDVIRALPRHDVIPSRGQHCLIRATQARNTSPYL